MSAEVKPPREWLANEIHLMVYEGLAGPSVFIEKSAYDKVLDERNRWEASAAAHANYVNKLLDKVLALEKECGREPGDY